MKVVKSLSINVGTHYPEPALIFTEQGEIFMTEARSGPSGFALVAFISKELLTGLLHQVLTSRARNGVVESEVTANTLHISAAANCFKMCGYEVGTTITKIEGGHDLQTITILGDGGTLTIEPSEQIQIPATIKLDSPIKTLVLRKEGKVWRKLF